MKALDAASARQAAGREWEKNLARQQALSQLLESMADALPGGLMSQQCLQLARSLYPMMRRMHAFEENDLFPVLMDLPAKPDSLPDSLERLRFEHMEDESYATEVCDALTEYVALPTPEKASVLSYMLRGFFDNLSRHIAFEREHLLPLLRSAD